MRVGVVGHIEWVEFARVEAVPAPGEIAHALEAWEGAAGGGAVAAVQLARLAGTSLFLTAVGDDEHGRAAIAELEAAGVRVAAAVRRGVPTRRGFTHIDVTGERTITVIGERLAPSVADDLPWDELATLDAIYVTAGDGPALHAARAARVLVATPRARETLVEGRVELDALVRSGRDPGETYTPGRIDPAPRLVVSTLGSDGGRWVAHGGASGTWRPAPLPGPRSDAYGAGDSFAAGLTYGLAAHPGDVDAAVALAARCGAAAMTGRAPFGGQLTLADDRAAQRE